MAAAALMDELIEEVFLHAPPDDPKCLLCAALVCKRWCRIISGPSFRRRFRELHRTPPMLAFFSDFSTPFMVSTSSFRPSRAVPYYYSAVDARHGRVLLHLWRPSVENPLGTALMVWDPITGERRKLPLLPSRSLYPRSWNAAVLCASPAGACDHLDCHRKPFLVALVGTDPSAGVFSYVYSSETAAWSEGASTQYPGYGIASMPSALSGNTLYFLLQCRRSIMKYDLGAREMSLIGLPSECISVSNVLMATEDGGLGVANLVNYRLCLWSREAGTGPEEDAGWVQSGDIDLKRLLPDEALLESLNVVGFAYGVSVIFLRSRAGIFTIDLKSCQIKKVYKYGWCNYTLPYVSFCTPALGAASTEGGRPGTSIA
ncbi:hypothetical protein BS78_05G027400 [Paspalum vaginatum]|nr:hypothetical protein BS78_05G027400 [Paspalum vaginatum]